MIYATKESIVARSIERLRRQKTHTLFTGYLYLQHRSAELGRLNDLRPEFLPFFRMFFRVGDHPLGAPYIKPFTEQKGSPKNLWLNENVAGSYAPSSLRPDQPFRQVVCIEGREYSLPHDHAQRARKYLLGSQPVDAADLAAFLYRDYGLCTDSPSIGLLIDIFAYEFGYSSSFGGPRSADFDTLFTLDSVGAWSDDCFEPVEAPLDGEEALWSEWDRISPMRTRVPVRTMTADELMAVEQVSSSGMASLRELVIDGLLSFSEETHFEFGRLNILVGPNGAGKSNVISCLRILQSAPYDIQGVFGRSGFEQWLYNGVDKQTGTALLEATVIPPGLSTAIRHQLRFGPSRRAAVPLEEVVSSINGDSVDQHFVGSYRGGATLSIVGAGRRRRERQLTEQEYDPFQSILRQIRDVGQYPEITRLSGFYSSFRIYSEWTFGRTSKLRDAAPTDRSVTMLSESMDDLPVALNRLEQTAAHQRILALLPELKETYRDYITRIVFGRVGLELVEAPFETAPLPADRLSDGTLRFLALAAVLLHPDPPPLICIEEPELGMHPDMIRMVANMIIDASSRAQMVISTHSEHLLSALQDDFDTLFAFDAGLAGSVVRRFAREEYMDWQQDHSLGELWTSGELGGNRW